MIRPQWKGNRFDDGCFVNEEFPYVPSLRDVIKWTMEGNPQRQEKRRDSFRLNVRSDQQFLQESTDCIVWLGHASFYIRVSGIVMLIDPVFYDLPFVKRYSRHAFSVSEIGHVDYLLLSHDHRDHCQKQSIREIVLRNPHVEILTGLQMDTLLRAWIPQTPIQCAGWYQQFKTSSNIAVCFLPTRHWGRRGYNDVNRRLWGAFTIQSATHTIYFGGDTGYGSHFKDASVLFPRIDVAILGIGAYKPSWFMAPNHMSPEEAACASNDLLARVMVPMHYGTFDLSNEPPGEPVAWLSSLKQNGELKADLHMLDPGEVLDLSVQVPVISES